MFTGIIEKIGPATRFGRVLKVVTDLEVQLGDSLAIDGVCLTVREKAPEPKGTALFFDLADETIARTRFQNLTDSESVNLERALAVGARLGGHFVQGHVDGVGTVIRGGRFLSVSIPSELQRYCVVKGSIALNGVSLTIHKLERDAAEFELVPYTLDHTNLNTLREGGIVNIEVDQLARYAEKLWKNSQPLN